MKIFSVLIISIITGITVTSCSGNKSTTGTNSKPGSKELEEINTYLVQKDRERIINYAERKNLVLKESSTGLWYYIINPGEGELLKENRKITIEFECELLDGTMCYSSDETGTKEIILGRSGIETGLYEGLRMLKPGAEAIFILPPFLAYGLPGDGKKIPPRSVIVYKVRILNIA
ncbi:MAG TPA: FKBP-type peptidyl-prolyl cis-trans isomerase [Bacteroidales bacterium]|nr:FKBP-type peptidyl-prolyl cis-trans isomerase [Bacteroidales bacterium]